MMGHNPKKNASRRPGGGIFAGTPHSHSKRPKLLKLAASRRFVECGYPVPPHEFTLKEVRDYFSHEKITCLICGKLYHKLGGPHLKLHNITVQEYLDRYGLPYRTGLVGRLSNARYSAATKKRIAEGLMPCLGNIKTQKMAAQAARRQRKRKINKDISLENLSINEISKEDVLKILEYIKEKDCSLDKACHENKRGGSHVRGKIREFKLEHEYQAAIDSLSIKTLVQSEQVTKSNTAKKLALKRRECGLSINKIAAEMNISVTTVRRLLYGKAFGNTTIGSSASEAT
jgi:predicted transcriptional regulator